MKGIRAYGSIISGISLIIVALFFSTSPSYSDSRVDVSDVSYWSYPDYTRIVITLSDNAEFNQKRLSNPDRLYFDIKNSRIKKELKTTLPVGNGMLKSIRAGQFDAGTVRVVLDLEKIKDYRMITLEDPVRLIIDVYGNVVFSSKKRVVIDPGHGGHDPGAVGPNKLCEKDAVLDIALKLRKILSEDPGLEVYLTRDKDIFIPLEERTAIANSKNADLFVSVHANASPRRDARGMETYLLNWTNDEEAMKVAARENRISLKKMKKMKKDMDTLDIELADLKRDHKRDESNKLANYIQRTMVDEMNKGYQNIVDHGVKWAPFYVLFGAQMPSVLVEVSFISNPAEEKLLSKDTYREGLANSIASGIRQYMSVSPEMQTIAGLRKAVDLRN